ncbi:hypothetical protein EOD39_7765 [Acipenser ruthenus]|uniref:Uncharacterized protein n=1 Tax=Acipenser ruthenus TaxID=7906 RepID=A0A444U5X0_ACIRT|nr:hypothetical protein EOD39_7765 [Acipenser ruthenus]
MCALCIIIRFDVSGVYPDKKKIGTYTEVRRRGPGNYNADTGNFSPAAVLRRAGGPGWKRAQETLRETQLPHVLYRDLWERKRILKRKLGPASYKMKDFIELRKERPASVLGVCESRERRFRSITAESCTLGPGTYGKGGIPSALLEERQRQSPGAFGSMDFNPSSKRSLQTSECVPGPGTYKVKDSLQELLNRTVSKRGPYDVFTGPRSRHASTGHYVVLKTTNLGPGQYEIKSFVEDLQNKEKKKSGEFSSLLQYPSTPTERVGCSTLSHCPRPAVTFVTVAEQESEFLIAQKYKLSVASIESEVPDKKSSSSSNYTCPEEAGMYDHSLPAYHQIEIMRLGNENPLDLQSASPALSLESRAQESLGSVQARAEVHWVKMSQGENAAHGPSEDTLSAPRVPEWYRAAPLASFMEDSASLSTADPVSLQQPGPGLTELPRYEDITLIDAPPCEEQCPSTPTPAAS